MFMLNCIICHGQIYHRSVVNYIKIVLRLCVNRTVVNERTNEEFIAGSKAHMTHRHRLGT